MTNRTHSADPSRIIVQFKGKLTEIDGVPYVRVPRLTLSHVTIGDRTHATAAGITARAELLHVNDTFRPVADLARVTHLSGGFIGTFEIDLGTRRGYLAARKSRQAIVTAWYDTPAEERTMGMLEMEATAHAAALAAFADHD